MKTELRREIQRSLPRFLSILVMAALGVLFLVGLRSAPPDMRRTADAYFDEVRMYDLQILSTLGLVQEDIDRFAETPGVACAEGGWALDAVLLHGEAQKLVKLLNCSGQLDLPAAVEGRLPTAANECAVDEHLLLTAELRIGDEVRFDFGDGSQPLAEERFTVTGIVQSPLYLSLDRGSSKLGDGNVNGFVLLPDASFALDYYTTAYLTLEGAAEVNAYDDAYDAIVQRGTDALTPVAELGAQRRYETLYAEGQSALQEAKDALAQARASGEAELADGQAKLDAARETLDAGWDTLRQKQAEYEAGKADGQAQLDAARAKLNDGAAQLADGWAQLDAAQRELDEKRAQAPAQIASAQAEIDAGRQALLEGQAKLNLAAWELALEKERVRAYEALLSLAGTEPSEEAAAQLAEMQQTLAAHQAEYDAAQAELEAGRAQLDAAQAELDAIPGRLEAAQAEIDAGRETLLQKEQELHQGEEALAAAEAQYRAGLQSASAALEAAEEELRQDEAEYEEKLAELEDGRAALETALADAQAEIGKGERALARMERAEVYVLGRSANYGFVSYEQNAERMDKLSEFFPVIFFLVAALVSLTTMTRMVEEERTQIGAVKALGFGTGAIAAKYLLYGTLAAALGAVPGCLIGTWLIPWVIGSSYRILYILPSLELRFDWPLCLAASAAGIGCTGAATLFAVLSTVRQTPAALMRPKAPKPGKRILLEHIKPLWRRLSFSVKVSARNLFRYKKRFWMTVIGVAGCTALLIAGLGLRRSVFDILDVQCGEIYRYDLQCTFDAAEPGAAQAVAGCVRASGNAASEAFANVRSVSIRSGSASVSGYLLVTDTPEALCRQIDLRDMRSGAPLTLTEDGAVIDQKLSELLGVRVGDTIVVDGGTPFELPVAGINEHYVYHYVHVSAALYTARSGEDYAPNTCYVTARDDAPEALSALSEKLLTVEGVSAVNNITALSRSFRHTLEAVDSAVLVIISSAAALALVVLYNLTNINVTERLRELATVKVLGFYDPEVAMYVYRENVVLTLLGIALGQLLGRVLCRWLVGTVEIDIVMFGRSIGLDTHLLSVALTLVFALFVNFLMYFRMKKIDMVESLKSVE